MDNEESNQLTELQLLSSRPIKCTHYDTKDTREYAQRNVPHSAPAWLGFPSLLPLSAGSGVLHETFPVYNIEYGSIVHSVARGTSCIVTKDEGRKGRTRTDTPHQESWELHRPMISSAKTVTTLHSRR